MEITIREMAPSDYAVFDRFLGQLHKLHQEARPDLFAPSQHPFSQKYFEGLLQSPTSQLLLAEADGKPAGFCLFEIEDSPRDPLMLPEKRAYLNDIFVAEEARRLGIASALYQEAERRARELGCKSLFLTVWAFNQDARGFYEKMGLSVRSYQMETKL